MTTYNKRALAHLGRRLVHNQAAFVMNNVMKHRELLRHSIPRFRTVFQSVPSLLQINLPKVPGYVDAASTPRGIHGFDRSDFSKVQLEFAKNIKINRRQFHTSQPVVESLFLMGSSGTIGYTAASDLDYWVCIDQKKLSHQELSLFKEKLKLITDWAEQEQGIEVTFFPIDLADLEANRLTHLTDEEPGDVFPLLLKEEVYRTLLHVVGRIPLWWAVPSGTYLDDYKQMAKHLDLIPNPNFYPQDFIDLGFPQKPPPREYIAAALWQIHKASQDPFKAAMKTMLILEQTESGLRAPLLCDQLKEKVLTSSRDRLPIDPYILTIRRVLKYCQNNLSAENQDLIRTSIFFKLYSPLSSMVIDKKSLKARFLRDLIKEWGWSQTKVKQMEGYSEWPESRKLALGEEINSFLHDLYTKISNRLRNDFPDQVKLNQDLATLHLQMLARYSNHDGKIETLPSIQYKKSLPEEMTLVFEKDRWNLYAGFSELAITTRSERLIYTSQQAARVAAWLVNNHLFTSKLNLLANSGSKSLNRDIFFSLMEFLSKNFTTVNFNNLSLEKTPVPRKTGPQILIINFEESAYLTHIVTAELVYRTTWGEMCHENLTIKSETDKVTQYRDLAEQVVGSEDVTLNNIKFFVHPTIAGKEILETFKTAFSLNLLERQASLTTPEKRLSKLKLDID
ncbi:MAG: class I adenylate cyclase [Deltaproteobacteria bacterium]|nr:class I adenylate cyclase [Deltaproteobacteria bacterium]